MQSKQQNGLGQSVRTIEVIVRTALLLLVPALVGSAFLLLRQHSVLAFAGVAAIAVLLVGNLWLLAFAPVRELLSLVLYGVLGATVCIFMALGMLPHLGLYRPATVLSGSMRPTFNPGDLIVVRPEPLRDVRVGQVISYSVPVGDHRIETHRVIRIIQGGDHPVVQTQGDANNWRDPWVARLQGTTAWRLSVVIPYGGYVISTMRSHTLHTLSIVVVPVALALLFLSYLWGLPGSLRRLRENRARI